MNHLLLLLLSLATMTMGQLGPAPGDKTEVDCSQVRCFGACRPGTCSPRPNGLCCDDLGKCSPGGCCGDRCRRNSDCKVGPCDTCNNGVCGAKSEPADCSQVRCFAVCPAGTCDPKPNGECCDDLSKCTRGGCCGNRCSRNRDCKAGPCGKCRNGVCGGKKDPTTDCSIVNCFAACEPGTCAPRPNGECCDNISQCSPGGCCGDRCRRNRDCKAGPCGKCVNGTCGGKDNGGDETDCSSTFCFAACTPGTCSPRRKGECCDDLSRCSRGGCCGDRCRRNRDCKKGPCSKCVRNNYWSQWGTCGDESSSGILQ